MLVSGGGWPLAGGSCIPAAPPTDPTVANRIKTLASYVCRNGAEFEQVVLKKESENPDFEFLRGGEHAMFYKWVLFCEARRYSIETVEQVHSFIIAATLNDQDHLKCEQVIESFRQNITGAIPGSVDLTPDDVSALMDLLQKNTGSKDSIRGIRSWVMRRAHSLMAIGNSLRAFAQRVFYNQGGSVQNKFLLLLHLIYVINDIFFNAASATNRGVYTSVILAEEVKPVDVTGCIWPYLAVIFNLAYNSCLEEIEKEKLSKVITLWESKKFNTSAQCEQLKNRMQLQPGTIAETPMADLISPFPKSIQVSNEVLGGVNQTLDLSVAPPTPGGATHGTPLQAFNQGQLLGQPFSFVQASVPDVQDMSVGAMTNLVKIAVKSGHKKYAAIDVSCLGLSGSGPFVEPGRLEVRVDEYLKKVQEIFGK